MARTTTGSKGNAVAHSECQNTKLTKRQRHCLEHAVRGHSRVPDTFYAVLRRLCCTAGTAMHDAPLIDLLPPSQALASNAVVCWPSEKANACKATLTKVALQFDSWPPTTKEKALAPWPHSNHRQPRGHGSYSKHMCRMRRPVPHPLHMQAGANVQR